MLDFLTALHHDKLGFSSLNSARSALSSFIVQHNGCTIGNSALVKRFMKGIFILDPPRPRYSKIWNVKVVLDFLKSLSPLCSLDLKMLTLKLTMLMVLVTAQRAQSVHLLKLSNMTSDGKNFMFSFSELLKQQSSTRIRAPVFRLIPYTKDPDLCVCTVLKEYLSRTANFRNSQDKLLLSFAKPHQAVTKDTVRRWIKTVLMLSGVDTSVYKCHSTRAASTSAAKRNLVSVDEIIATAGWSNARTFGKFYDKPLQEHDSLFSSAMLDNIERR